MQAQQQLPDFNLAEIVREAKSQGGTAYLEKHTEYGVQIWSVAHIPGERFPLFKPVSLVHSTRRDH